MEPAVADGGEVVIYAPHIDEVSYTHGKLIDEIGYHCRDYFLKQWDKFKRLSRRRCWPTRRTSKDWARTMRPRRRERRASSVTLATGIPEERCRRINLGYLDPGDDRT